jgi:hypothetical protein
MAHSATLLNDGKVLIAGGVDFTDLLPTAELYDATTRSFTETGSLGTARFGHTATLLLDGRVLIAGGTTLQFGGFRLPTTSAEIYDPATGTFSPTGQLQLARSAQSATLLENGKVLIAGGAVDGGVADTIEIYDPLAGTFTTGPVLQGLGLSATRLNDGSVLLAGGAPDEFTTTAAAKLYSAVTGSVAPTGNLTAASRGHTANKLPDGTVLVTGGSASEFSGFHNRAEKFNLATGSFSSVQAMINARAGHTANTLADGSVLVVGGAAGSDEIGVAERFDPDTLEWLGAGSMTVGRSGHTATTLADGTVLVVGGISQSELLDYAELYGPPLPPPTSLTINPSSVTLRKGGTRQYAAFDELGRPRHDATWTVSDTTLVSIGAYSSPTLTALGYGQAMVSATVGAVTSQAGVIVEPASLSVTPSTVTMLVGESRAFSVVDEFGQPQPGASWSINASSVATVIPGSGVVSAVATGGAVLTGSVGAVSATAALMVSAGPLPEGSVRWSVPELVGSTSRQVIQSDGVRLNGASLFAIDSTATQTQIRGLSRDGRQLWHSAVVGPVSQVTPNGHGGILLTIYAQCDNQNPMRLVSIDGVTGISEWQFAGEMACPSEPPQVAARPDGGLSITTAGNLSGFPSFMVLDASGNPLNVPSIPQSTFTSFNGQQTQGYSRVGTPMVDPSGATYVLYEVRHVAYPPQVTQTAIWLMKVEADNTWLTTEIASTTENVNQFPGRILPDDHGGVLVTWTYSPAQGPSDPNPLRAAHVSRFGDVTTYPLPAQPTEVITGPNSVPVNPMLVLGENDRAFASYGATVMAFNITTGALIWSVNANVPVTMISSDAHNSLIAKTTSAGLDTIVIIDPLGAQTTTSFVGVALDYFHENSWLGLGDSVKMHVGGGIDTSSIYPSPTMGRTNAAKKYFSNYNRIILHTTATPDTVFNDLLRTFRGITSGDMALVDMIVNGAAVPPNVTAVGQVLRFTLASWAGSFQGPFDVVTVRYDPDSRVIVVETVDIPSDPYHGHPLMGWRYFKVHQPEPNRIAVETGALSRPALEFNPALGVYRWVAFGLDKYFFGDELQLWEQMLVNVHTALNEAPYPGATVSTSDYPGLVGGKWDWMDKKYIIGNLCGETFPFSIPLICY